MFSEKQYIEDFINTYHHNILDYDYNELKIEVNYYKKQKLEQYSIDELKYITELYYSFQEINIFGEKNNQLYNNLAKNALDKLSIKIIDSYIEYELSDCGTDEYIDNSLNDEEYFLERFIDEFNN